MGRVLTSDLTEDEAIEHSIASDSVRPMDAAGNFARGIEQCDSSDELQSCQNLVFVILHVDVVIARDRLLPTVRIDAHLLRKFSDRRSHAEWDE